MENSAAPAAPGITEKPPRPPKLKLDEKLLMSDRGFKYLREKMKDLKFGGDVNDIEPNLEKLMLLYREWAHYLFPEAKFSDFITKVRKECSSRNMKLYLTTLKSQSQQQQQRKHQEHEAEGLSDIDFDDLVFETKKETDCQNQSQEDDDDDFLLDFYEEENSSDHGDQCMNENDMN